MLFRSIVTTGEGGAVTTDDAGLDERIRSLRHHGWSPSDRYDDMPAAGFNYRLPDLLCAIGTAQVRRLAALHAARARIASAYAERLATLPVVLPEADPGDVHGWQAFVVQVDRRDAVLAALRAEGIEAQIGTYALPRLSAYRDQGSFPGAERAYERALALPFHTRLTESEIDRVSDALRRLL